MIHVTWEVSSSRVGTAAAFFCPRNIHFQRFCSGKLCDGEKRSALLFLFVFSSYVTDVLSLVVLLCTLSISCGFFWIPCFLSLTYKAPPSSLSTGCRSLLWAPGPQMPLMGGDVDKGSLDQRASYPGCF